MIVTEGSLIIKRKDGHLDVDRGRVDIRFVEDSKGMSTISLTYGNVMVFAESEELVKFIRKEGGAE